MRPATARSPLALIVTLGALSALGCGARASSARVDADVDGPTPADGAVGGLLTFDVVATLSSDGGATLPSTNKFTLGLDRRGLRLVAGGGGTAEVVPVTTQDGKTFRTTKAFSIRNPSAACAGAAEFKYETFELTLAGTSLRGQARGTVVVSCGDCLFYVSIAASLAGQPDATPPSLVPSAGAPGLDPFGAFHVFATEPLAGTSSARLVGSAGDAIALVPTIEVDAASGLSFVVGFSKPDVVLGPGGGYAIELDRLVDLAGQTGSASAPLRLGTFTPPPLVPADGFESTTETKLGGADVVTGGDLMPIAGKQSLYLAPSGGPTLATGATDDALILRLAVPPGAKTLSFSYRLVGRFAGLGFFGAVAAGSIGKMTGGGMNTFDPSGPQTSTTWSDGTIVYVGAVKTMQLALPSDLTNEVVFAIVSSTAGCGGPIPPAGLLVDDLRVE